MRAGLPWLVCLPFVCSLWSEASLSLMSPCRSWFLRAPELRPCVHGPPSPGTHWVYVGFLGLPQGPFFIAYVTTLALHAVQVDLCNRNDSPRYRIQCSFTCYAMGRSQEQDKVSLEEGERREERRRTEVCAPSRPSPLCSSSSPPPPNQNSSCGLRHSHSAQLLEDTAPERVAVSCPDNSVCDGG